MLALVESAMHALRVKNIAVASCGALTRNGDAAEDYTVHLLETKGAD